MKKLWKKIALVWLIIALFFVSVFTFKHLYYTQTIVIDPGHGGYDSGAIGYDQTTLEKDVSLQIATKIGKEIKKINPRLKVIYTRTDDNVFWPSEESADLQARIRFFHEANADFYLSIHMNANDIQEAYGYNFHLQDGDKVSEEIAQNMEENFQNIQWSQSRGIVYTSMQPLYFMNQIDHALLLETGFITNPEECQKLNNPIQQKKIAQAIAQAICDYYEKD